MKSFFVSVFRGGSGRQRFAMAASCLLLAVFLVHNLVWLDHNYRRLPCWQSLCVSPRSLEEVAAQNTSKVVRGRFATYYLLRRLAAGKEMTVPIWLEKHSDHLEAVTRIYLEYSSERMVVPDSAAPGLRESSTETGTWLRRGGSRPLVQTLYVSIDANASSYVLAESSATYGDLFLITAARYRSLTEGAP
jgi:hypothetical protein